MSKIWSFVNDLKVKKNHKITMFIWFTTILYGLTGGLIWGLMAYMEALKKIESLEEM